MCIGHIPSCGAPHNSNQIGFDLVNVQFSTRFLDPSVASRVQWKHGNLYVTNLLLDYQDNLTAYSLTTKLPFEDDEFDHVHVSSIARGVPENKVSAFVVPSVQ